MNLQKTEFRISAGSPASFIRDGQPQIVFAGRSNVGKSSVINCLLQRKNLARVGEQPGKTVHVNYFQVDGAFYLVDLPGYGYAKVSKEEKARWANLMEPYFAEADRITLGVLVVDSRHKPTENDCVMAQWFRDAERPFLVVANKLDKLKKSEVAKNLECVRTTLSLTDDEQLIGFSAESNAGRDALLRSVLGAAIGVEK